MLLWKLAWRNIWRNKRRSILTLLAIGFATMAAISMRGIQLGTYEVNIKNAVEGFAGYLQIQKMGYQKNPSLNANYKLNDKLINIINSITEIKGYAPRVYASGLISFKDNSLGSSIFGIEPEQEKTATKILDRIHEGRFFSADSSHETVVGYKLLTNLKASIEDEIIVLSQGADGSLGNLKFKIVGTLKTGSQEFDAMAVFIGLKTSQELLSLYGNKINTTVITLQNIEDIDGVQSKLIKSLNDPELAVLPWTEVMPDFKNSIDFDNVSGIFYLLILIVIVAFGILNTVLMSVTERFNEFGVTLSIGMPQIKLVYLVILETFIITVIGVIIGNLVGLGINYYILLHPIEFGGDLAWVYEEYGFLPRIESTLKLSIFLNNSLLVLFISLVSSLYPAAKVYNLEPLKGIRYT